MTETKKQYKLDLFKQTLPALHRRNGNFYASLSEEERKEIAPLVLMRWISAVDSTADADTMIWMVNELVNMDFWVLSKHPELQWRLMAAANTGRSQRNTWIPGTKKKNLSKVDKLLLELYPSLNDQELNLVRSKLDKDSLKQLLRDMAMPDNEMKAIMNDYKNQHSNT